MPSFSSSNDNLRLPSNYQDSPMPLIAQQIQLNDSSESSSHQLVIKHQQTTNVQEKGSLTCRKDLIPRRKRGGLNQFAESHSNDAVIEPVCINQFARGSRQKTYRYETPSKENSALTANKIFCGQNIDMSKQYDADDQSLSDDVDELDYVDKLRSQRFKIENLSEQFQHTKNKLKADNDQLRRQNEEYARLIQSYDKSEENYKRQMQALNAKLAESSEQVSRLTGMVRDLEQENIQHLQTNSQLSHELYTQLQAMKNKYEQQFQQLKAFKQDQTQTMSHLEQKIRDKDRRIAQLFNEKNSLQTTLDSEQFTKMEESKRRIMELETSNCELQSSKRRVESQMESIIEGFQEYQQNVMHENQQNQQQIKHLKKDNKSMKNELREKNRELLQMQDQYSSNERQRIKQSLDQALSSKQKVVFQLQCVQKQLVVQKQKVISFESQTQKYVREWHKMQKSLEDEIYQLREILAKKEEQEKMRKNALKRERKEIDKLEKIVSKIS